MMKSLQVSTTAALQQGNNDQPQRGYAANRNEKLHLLARQKRTTTPVSASDHAGDRSASGRSSSGTVGRSLGPAPQHKVVRLSTVLQQAPQHFDRVKVAAVERMLTDIDPLPEPFQSAEIVYLSRNCLTNLEGVQQFQQLRVLSAADNLLPDLDCLEVLTACPSLQIASFERNPLTGLPNYRQKVLQLLPNLENLDGQIVTPQERARVHQVLKQEAACMAVMLSNACMVHKLAKSAELLQLHTDLRRTMFGTSSLARMTRGVLPSYIPLDLLKFLKLWDYEGSLSSEERRVITDALTREVVRVHKQLQQAAATLKGPAQLPELQAWDTAFAKVMLAQQRTIIQLVELVNMLHGEAATLVSKLTGQQPPTASEHQQPQEQEFAAASDRQFTADQRLAHERESLIIDLRDAALELAGLIAAGETASDAAHRCITPETEPQGTWASPQRLLQPLLEQTADIPPGVDSAGQLQQQQQQQQQQQMGLKQAKQGSSTSLSLRRRSSVDSHESLRLRPSPKPDKTPAGSSCKVPNLPVARSGGSPFQPGTSRPPPTAPAGAGRRSPGVGAGRSSPGPLSGASMRVSRHQLVLRGSGEQQQQQSGRYDRLAFSQSPSPEPSQTFGPPAQQSPNSKPVSPQSTVSDVGSASRAPVTLSPTAKRLLHSAQQHQQQQQWDVDGLWQHRSQERRPEGHLTGMSAVPLTEQPSEQWRALQQLGSAQHLLAALEHSPPSRSAAGAGVQPTSSGASTAPAATSPSASTSIAAVTPGEAATAATAATAAQPRPSLQSRGIGPLVRSPGLLSPCSSPESPVREGIKVYNNKAQESWGSRLPSQPSSLQSWQGGQIPAPLLQQQQQQQQQQQELWLDTAAAAALAAQHSFLEHNPMQSPADASQPAAASRGSSAVRGTLWPATKLPASAPASPAVSVRRGLYGSPAASEPAGSLSHSAAAASIGSLVGPCRAAVPATSPTLQGGQQMVADTAHRQHTVVGHLAAAAAAGAGGPRSPQGDEEGEAAAAGPQQLAGSPRNLLRKSVSWADRLQQQQQQQLEHIQRWQQQQELHHTQEAGGSPAGGTVADGGLLFAEDTVPGACAMYSPYVVPAGSRQQASKTQAPSATQAASGVDMTSTECVYQTTTAGGASDPGSAPATAAAAAAEALAGTGMRASGAAPNPDSPMLSVSPALSTAVEPASDAVAMMELSDLSGMSNQSPSSVQFGGGQATPPHSMNFNVLYSAYVEARSDQSDTLSGQYSNPRSGMSGGCGAYETRDLSRARGIPAGRGRGTQGGSPGAQGEISFALKGESPGSQGSSPGEAAAWLAAAAEAPRRRSPPRGVAGMLGVPQGQHQLQQQGGHQSQGLPQGIPQQQERQLLWDLLQSEEDNMQLESPSSGPSAGEEAAALAAGATATVGGQVGPSGRRLAAPAVGGSAAAGAAAGLGLGPYKHAQPVPQLSTSTVAGAAAAAGAAAGRAAAGTQGTSAQGAAAAGAGYCGSSRGSFSSSMDLSPVKRQLFRSVSRSYQSLLQDAAGLSSIAAQLDAAATVATGHGSSEAAAAGRQALMAKQQRLELHQRVQQAGALSQQLGACPEHQRHEGGLPQGPVTLHGARVSVAARKALSSSAETASSWAASSITPYVNEATAAAEAALAAAEAAAQLSTSCPAALTMMHPEGLQAYSSDSSGSNAGGTSDIGQQQMPVEGVGAARAAAGTAPEATDHGVLLGLTPVAPSAADRRAEAAAANYSPAASDAEGSPRSARAHGTDAVAKALFASPRGAGGADANRGSGVGLPAQHVQQRAVQPQEPSAALQAAAGTTAQPQHAGFGPPVGLSVITEQPAAAMAVHSAPASPAFAASLSRAAASSLPASPMHGAGAAALSTSGASSLPASPAPAAAAAAAAVANLNVRRSGSGLGPRSTAALADLQSQLLTMAVEKVALQRQLQQGRTEVEKLQEKACKTDQLEQVVHQMRSDLQQATQLLEHTGGAVQEQAQLNHQLQEQMQQLQQQLCASEAEKARQAAADQLARISLCRRMLRHFAAAAAATGEWRRLKQAAQLQGQALVQRRVLVVWHAAVQQSKAVAALQQGRQQRMMAAVLAAWAQLAWEERVAAAQEVAALGHWARRACRRALARWLFYTQQVRLLGVELPSPSSTSSSARASPEGPSLPVSTPASTAKMMPAAAAQAAAQLHYGQQSDAYAATGHVDAAGLHVRTTRSAVRSLGPSFGAARPSHSGHHQQQQQQDSEQEQSPEKQPSKFAKSAKLLSAGLVSLTERLSEALSPPKGARQGGPGAAGWPDSPTGAAAAHWQLPHATRRSTVGGFEQQQQHEPASLRQRASALISPLRLGARSMSMPGVDPATAGASMDGTAGPQPVVGAMQPATTAVRAAASGAPWAAGAVSRDVGLSVPLSLRVSFMAASRSQRLRRRWLLVKAFNRWHQLLGLRAAENARMAAAARHAARRLQRRAWAAWQHYLQYRRDKQQLHPFEVRPGLGQLLQQHLRSQQLRQLLKVLGAWRQLCRAADMRRRTALLLARQRRRHVQRLVLGALADHADRQYAKRCRQHKADRHCASSLLQKAWYGWKDSIGLSHAAAAWHAQQSQQLLARAVCRWQQLSAAVTAAAADGATENRLALLQHRWDLTALRSAFGTWRAATLQAAANAAADALGAAQQQLQQLQTQCSQDQQQLQQLSCLLDQQGEVQQQLVAVSAAKQELQQVVEQQHQQLQQQAVQHQQQMAALRSEHELGVTVLQEQLQQACANADETMQQLQRLQNQHTQLQMEQQARANQLEHQVAQQKQELEQQARQQLQRLDQQQLQWHQQARQDQHLMEQLANRKAQCQELALQLKRCTEKLNSQTAAVQAVKAELADTQNQLTAARAVSRSKSLSLTEKAVAAERSRSEVEQQLAQQEAANRQLQQQLVELHRQLEQQRSYVEAKRIAAAAEQGSEVMRLQEQLAQKDDVIHQLRDSMGAVQAQLASQQAKVLSEITQLRNGWSQAKQIIKQQRKTIKAQELQLQLQLLGPASSCMEPHPVQQAQQQLYGMQTQQQQAVGVAHMHAAPPGGVEALSGALQYPITSWVLQRQQQQQVGQSYTAAGAPAHQHAVPHPPVGSLPQPVGAQQPVQQPQAAAGFNNLSMKGAAAAAVLRQPLEASGAGAGPAGGIEPQQTVLSRTSELLQCTDNILKSLRAKTVQT